MSKIMFNSENFEKKLKKGLSFAVAVATVGTLAGCAGNNVEDTNAPSTSINTILPEETTPVYDFELIEGPTVSEVSEVFDWTDTEKKITEKDDNAWLVAYSSHDIVSGISRNKYALAICEEPYKFGNTYHRLVDSEGNYVGNDKIEEAFPVNDNVLVYSKRDITDRDGFENVMYTIFDQITGASVDVEAYSLTSCNGIIIKSIYDYEDAQLKYELLNVDGTKAVDTVYDGSVFDDYSGILYLSKDGVTEAVDTNTLKARKIDGTIENAEAGYITISKEVKGSAKVKDAWGVMYLTNVTVEPIQVIPAEHTNIFFCFNDTKNPLFSVIDYNIDSGLYEHRLVDENGQVVVDVGYDFFTSCFDGNLVKAYHRVNLGDDNIYLYDVFNAEGEKIIGDLAHDMFQPVPGTDKAIFRNGENDQYGVMNFDGEYLVMPSFDELYSSPVYVRQEDGSTKIVDCYLIGRINSENKTVVYNKDLEVVSTGDFSYGEGEDIALAHHTEKENAKVLVKED